MAFIEAHPDLTPDPNPLEPVGAPAVLHAPVRHSRPMLSNRASPGNRGLLVDSGCGYEVEVAEEVAEQSVGADAEG
ncbi:hypothetical protein [Nocardia beijingensis]|uniref:hypothetical protein n=1 Tax=Nocardia beijingensis TaxID=95162 RepID=UPI001E5A2456|nr:hypothetical protein [Nocardia beijingensis]